MGTAVWVVVVLVVLAGVAGSVVYARRRSAGSSAATSVDASRSTITPAAPMTGLESALDQAMDRSGRKMREKLEAEAGIVDGLKSSEDTGPILRRALDRVEHAGEQPPASA